MVRSYMLNKTYNHITHRYPVVSFVHAATSNKSAPPLHSSNNMCTSARRTHQPFEQRLQCVFQVKFAAVPAHHTPVLGRSEIVCAHLLCGGINDNHVGNAQPQSCDWFCLL